MWTLWIYRRNYFFLQLFVVLFWFVNSESNTTNTTWRHLLELQIIIELKYGFCLVIKYLFYNSRYILKPFDMGRWQLTEKPFRITGQLGGCWGCMVWLWLWHLICICICICVCTFICICICICITISVGIGICIWHWRWYLLRWMDVPPSAARNHSLLATLPSHGLPCSLQQNDSDALST